MTDYSNWKILKTEADEKEEEYTEVANWCDENGYHIEETELYYEVVINSAPTIEEMQNKVRYIRDYLINDIEWRETRYKDQIELQIPTDDTEEEYHLILLYKQYLRDYTKIENWWLFNPKTFEEWLNSIDNNL